MTMEIDQTRHGLTRARFTDICGCECSMQDSAIATEACAWLGVDRDETGGAGRGMHLTARMARRLADMLSASAQTGSPGFSKWFTDRDGSECTFHVGDDGTVLLGVTATIDSGADVSLMTLDAPLMAEIQPMLVAFSATGTIGGTCEETAKPPVPVVEMDVKIPPSMLNRTEIGGSGVSARTMIDAILDLLDGESLDTLRERVGHDRAEDLLALRQDIGGLRAD